MTLNLQHHKPVQSPELRKRTKITDIAEYTAKQTGNEQNIYSKNKGQKMDQMLHRAATMEMEEIKGTTKQDMTG